MRAFFLPIRKKKYWPASKSYSSWRPISKANKLFCFVMFFFSWILVLFFNFLFYFILLFFLWGREVFLSIACPRLLIPSIFDNFFINHISVKEMQLKFMQRKIIKVYVFVIECILHRELIMNEKKFFKDIYDQKC